VKGLRLTFGVDKSAPDTIRGDSMRLRQILVNLLGNAVKFTSEGMVSLTVTGAPDEDGRERITFVVRDSGPGIPAEHQQRIFDSFSQVDPSISRKYGGTGLGLAISRSLAEQMGGSLWVESRPGEGSAFHFTIPAEAVEAIVTPATREQSSPEIELSDMPPLRVIVAEDNPVNRALAVAFLHRLGYHADAAVNGAKLLAALDHTDYDVILMDMQMPEIDGIEATRRVRQNRPADRQPRIIALTAAAFPEDRARCLEAGMDDYVSKPVDLIELAEALRRAGRAMLSAA
jgi:CheY-like chemotaxis protein